MIEAEPRKIAFVVIGIVLVEMGDLALSNLAVAFEGIADAAAPAAFDQCRLYIVRRHVFPSHLLSPVNS
jgi:hypothetical protein